MRVSSTLPLVHPASLVSHRLLEQHRPEHAGGAMVVFHYILSLALTAHFFFAVVFLLPAFFNNIVQNTLVALQFMVKYLFTVSLAWIFRCVTLHNL